MKAFVKNFAGSAFLLAVVCGDALARPCGASPLPACELPEPTSPLLFVVAAAAAVAVYRFRK